jgi:hypothetical protein
MYQLQACQMSNIQTLMIALNNNITDLSPESSSITEEVAGKLFCILILLEAEEDDP